MCGIAGTVVPTTLDRTTDATRRMTDALARRGPDGEGVHRWPGVALGHRRLAIFDLSDAGSQPMVTADGRLGVVFNGAIYNFQALRAELEREGATFRSRTDTEVLLHGYRAWGLDALVARLRGMFAFALWDEDRRRLALVRDRLGVKPLVYALGADGSLAFASTVRALDRGGFGTGIDAHAIADVFEYGYVDEQRAIVGGVAKLPPATILEWTEGRVSSRRYWQPPAAGDAGPVSFEEAVEETERRLLRAVELRLQADVPVAALLSGGIDSALVCWAIRRLGGDVRAFTVATPGHAADESAAAIATAREIGIPHEILPLTALDDSVLGELVDAYPEPFPVASALGMLRVSQAVRQSATVLLTGDGGDDVFLGYPRHRHMLDLQRYAALTPPGARHVWRAVRRALPERGALKRARHLIDYATGGLGAFLSATPGLPNLRRHGILGERLAGLEVEARRLPQSVPAARRLLDDYLRFDLQHQFVAEYLAKVDGATMYWGLEARSPFLDQDLWEFAASLPYEVRMHRGELKAVLRELVRRRISPRAAAERKRGFSIPVEHWMQTRWRALAAETLTGSRLAGEGFIDEAATLRALRDPALPEPLARQLWYVMVTELWARARESGAAAPALAEAAVG